MRERGRERGEETTHLTMPLRNSMKVPLHHREGQLVLVERVRRKTHRLMGMSRSAMWWRTKRTSCLYLSSPRYLMKLWLSRGLPSLIAVRPFSAKQ